MQPVELPDLVDVMAELRSELHALRGEMARLSARVQQMQETLTRVSSRLLSDPAQQVALEAERDAYRTSLYALTRRDVPLRPEEYMASQTAAPSLEQFITELKREDRQ